MPEWMKRGMHTSKTLVAPVPDQRQPRSLRLHLILSYSALLAVALGAFALLVLFLTTNAINQSVDDAVRAEARIASLDVTRELSSTPPYWPIQLSLPVINTYSDPGVVIEIVDVQGTVRYPLSLNPAESIP